MEQETQEVHEVQQVQEVQEVHPGVIKVHEPNGFLRF